MNASISTRPARSAASKAASTSAGWRDSGFSHSTCLPASSARTRPRHVQRVRQRVVDRVDLGVGQQLLVGAVRPRDAVLVRVGPRARARRASRPRRPRRCSPSCAPSTMRTAMFAVDRMPQTDHGQAGTSIRSASDTTSASAPSTWARSPSTPATTSARRDGLRQRAAGHRLAHAVEQQVAGRGRDGRRPRTARG